MSHYPGEPSFCAEGIWEHAPTAGLFILLNFGLLRCVIMTIQVLFRWKTVVINIPLLTVIVLPGHPEGCGLITLRGHRCPVPAAHGWYLESPKVLQQHSACSNGSRAWGPQNWLVQPLCTPPFLRGHRGQLWCHADESYKDPQHAVQSKVKTWSYFLVLWSVGTLSELGFLFCILKGFFFLWT